MMTKKPKTKYITPAELEAIKSRTFSFEEAAEAINELIQKKLTKKPTVNEAFINEIAEFYCMNISKHSIQTGRKNLAKLLKTVEAPVIMQAVKNYHETLRLTGKLGSPYTIYLSNFCGQQRRFEDYLEAPEMPEKKRDTWAEED